MVLGGGGRVADYVLISSAMQMYTRDNVVRNQDAAAHTCVVCMEHGS